MSKSDPADAEKNQLTDLFLRGVRSNPRDMALAAEKFELLKGIVRKDARLNQIIDQQLLLKIALLQNLLGEQFSKLTEEPRLLRDWELGIKRPSFPKNDDEGARLFGEILKPIRSSRGEGAFAELHPLDLRLYGGLAAHDAGRAVEALNRGMVDVASRVEDIRCQLEGVGPAAGKMTSREMSRYEEIIRPYRRAMRVRHDVPADFSAFMVALIELACSEQYRGRVTRFFDYVSDRFPTDVFLIRWEIIVRVTTLGDSRPPIDLVRKRARTMAKEQGSRKLIKDLREQLLGDDQSVTTKSLFQGMRLERVGKYPVTNGQYEVFDPGHVVLRYPESRDRADEDREQLEGKYLDKDRREKDSPVAILNLIEAALFCEWLNAFNEEDSSALWAHVPGVRQWQQAVRGSEEVEKVARNVWEWTTSPLDEDPEQEDSLGRDVLTEKALPHVWVCGGSWYQEGADDIRAADAAKQLLWFPAMHHRPDVGFRIFWYKKDRYGSHRVTLAEELEKVKVLEKRVKELEENSRRMEAEIETQKVKLGNGG